MKSKKLLSEIDRNRELMGLIPLNEAYEDLPPIVDTYFNIDFHERTKEDRLPKNLLDDIQFAAAKAGIKITVNYARKGHKQFTKSGNLSRHWRGVAVDLSSINGYGWSSKKDARDKGIYDGIENFVANMKDLGYKINQEIGNSKAVLYFGFDADHNNHIHVSNQTSEKSTYTPSKKDTTKKTDVSQDDEPDDHEGVTTNTNKSDVDKKNNENNKDGKKDTKPKTAADAIKSFFDYELPEPQVISKIKSFFEK